MKDTKESCKISDKDTLQMRADLNKKKKIRNIKMNGTYYHLVLTFSYIIPLLCYNF